MSKAARIADFRRQAAGGSYNTSLRAVGNERPHDSGAISHWRVMQPIAKPICFGCGKRFSDTLRPGAFVAAVASRSPSAGVAISGLCAVCWRTLTPDAIEAAAVGVLRRNLNSHGKFMD
jgi:hypothetical protein